MEGRGGLSGNVAEEAFCLKSAPDYIGTGTRAPLHVEFRSPGSVLNIYYCVYVCCYHLTVK